MIHTPWARGLNTVPTIRDWYGRSTVRIPRTYMNMNSCKTSGAAAVAVRSRRSSLALHGHGAHEENGEGSEPEERHPVPLVQLMQRDAEGLSPAF